MALFPATAQKPGVAHDANPWSWWTSLFVLCAILGALIGLSFKTQNTIRQTRVPASNYQGLVQEYLTLKTNMGNNVSLQQKTIQNLQSTNERLVKQISTGGGLSKVLADELKLANFQAGLTPVQGPGLVVTLTDSKMQIANAPASALPIPGAPNLIHDTDLNQTVNELKAAGAEAIAINNQRLVGMSPIRCAGPTVYVNNTPQTPPYAIRAIGDPATLETAMNLPNGVADGLRRMDPAMIRMQKAARVVIPAYSGASVPRYAKPVASARSRSDVATPLVAQNGKG